MGLHCSRSSSLALVCAHESSPLITKGAPHQPFEPLVREGKRSILFSDGEFAISMHSQNLKPMKSHHRIAPRHRFESTILICFSRNGGNITARGWARDLSESGLRAFVAEPLVIGEQVTLEIALPSFKKEQIPARVARQLGTRYGFQFTALSFQQRYEIRAATKAQPLVPD